MIPESVTKTPISPALDLDALYRLQRARTDDGAGLGAEAASCGEQGSARRIGQFVDRIERVDSSWLKAIRIVRFDKFPGPSS